MITGVSAADEITAAHSAPPAAQHTAIPPATSATGRSGLALRA
ncbi:hypothetical protein [Actinomadura chibensis]|nr:hypothetical protein [Actinomadura chibensis]